MGTVSGMVTEPGSNANQMAGYNPGSVVESRSGYSRWETPGLQVGNW